MIKFTAILVLLLAMISCKTSQRSVTKDSSGLEKTYYLKNRYLIQGNQDSLAMYVHKDITFCHSNCWYEDLKSLLSDEEIKQLDYKNIIINELTAKITENIGIVRGNGHFIIKYKNQDLDLNLCFVETYIYQNNRWLLLARQSSKVPEK